MPATRPRSIGFLAAVSGVLLLGLAGSLRADPEDTPEGPLVENEIQIESLPEVPVTARKWTEDPQVVPQSLTVLSYEQLLDAGATSIREAAFHVPNLNMVEFSARRLSFPFVRGIGSGQGDPAVATYVDGVPQLSPNSANLPLLGVERIEFLRGPQGTLYGRNALGGVFHVVTRKPSNTWGFRAAGTLGTYALRELRLLGNVPIRRDRLALSVAGLHVRRDGYTINDFTGNDVDTRNTFFGQGQLLWTPDERNEIRFSIYGERTRDGGFVLSDLEGLRARPLRIQQDFEGVTERDVIAPSITWTRTGGALDLTSVTSFTRSDVLETADFDFSTLDGIRRQTEEWLGAFTQEFRISPSACAPPLRIGRCAEVRWLAGAFLYTSESARTAVNDYRPGGVGIISPVSGTDTSRGDFDDYGVSAFGQATATLFEKLEIGAGLRFDYESRRAALGRAFVSGGTTLTSSSGRASEEFEELLPRIDVAWRCAPGITVYGFAAKGFKAGGFNLDAPAGRIAFAPETSWTFEGGAKASLFDDRLHASAACFYIDWDNMQLSQFDAMVGGYVTNAGAATSQGLEFELSARPVRGLDVFTAFGYTDTGFTSYVDPYGVDVSGNNLPFAPATTWSAGAQFTGCLGRGLRYHLRGEYLNVGPFYYDPGNLEEESYALANFRAGISGRWWRLEAWVRNAFDESYVPVAFQPSPLDPSVFVGESGAPRTYGITLSVTP